MHGDRADTVEQAACKRCGKQYGKRGLDAAFGWCLDCHARESLEAPFFQVTCGSAWVVNNGQKTFFFRGQIYKRTDWPEWMIRALIAGFKPVRNDGTLTVGKYYFPLKEGT